MNSENRALREAPAPLFRDPVYEGATDPTIIWNRREKSWWIVYTARRATDKGRGVAWVHGSDLGVASSDDHGRTWLYRGTLELEPIEKGRNTFWAPEILYHAGRYHMFVSYITGVPEAWVGSRRILHYTAEDLWTWKFEGILPLPSRKVIDACVYPAPEGWRLWYKDEEDGNHTHFASSPDLYEWAYSGVATSDQAQEGPNVFSLGGETWMIADIWDGFAVYKSRDLTGWERQEGSFLSEPGVRPDDQNRAHHADVLSFGDHAYLFYFTHPDQNKAGAEEWERRRSALQTALLRVENGRLTVTRNEPFDFYLPDPPEEGEEDR